MVHVGVKPVPGPVGGSQLGEEALTLGVEAGVLDGYGGLGRQHLHDGLVLLREGLAVGFVDEVEVSDGLPPHPTGTPRKEWGMGWPSGTPTARRSSEAPARRMVFPSLMTEPRRP